MAALRSSRLVSWVVSMCWSVSSIPFSVWSSRVSTSLRSSLPRAGCESVGLHLVCGRLLDDL